MALINNTSRRAKATPTPLDRVMAAGAAARPQGSFAKRVLRPLGDRLTAPGSALMKNVRADDIRYKLLQAGFPLGLRVQDFVLLKFLMTIGIALIFAVILVPAMCVVFEVPIFPQVVLLGGAFGAFYGFKFPDIWLSMTIKRRKKEIQLAMPDMIDLITISVEAGLGLDAAIQRVSGRFPNALSEEFQRSMQEVRLGRTRIEALRDMGRRVDVHDLTSFITSLVQAEQLGIAIANVLRVQSERLREKRSQRAREQAQKAPIKMVFPLVLFIFPALFVIILGPVALQMMTTSFGG